MKIPFGKPIIEKEEKDAVSSVLDGTTLVHGPKAIQFEESFRDFTGAAHAVSVSSCTAGMHLIYFTLGISKGDEVIVPSQTHVATAHAVELTGAKPVFVDSNKIDGNIDTDLIELAISEKTKAIAIVHYLGVPVNIDKVVKIAKKYNLFVLEDCALSIGSKVSNKHTGLIGDAGVFSFYPVKHMTTGEGGMIIMKDSSLLEDLKLKKAFGVTKNHTQRDIPGMYDVEKLGYNYRMSEIHAAIGNEQVKKLPRFIQQREENYLELYKGLSSLEEINLIPEPSKGYVSSRYCLAMMLNTRLAKKRNEFMHYLSSVGIGTSIYYPHPVPRLTYYNNKYKIEKNNYKHASQFSDNSICLPVGPHLSSKDMRIISSSIKTFLGKN